MVASIPVLPSMKIFVNLKNDRGLTYQAKL